jgi:LAS superfamily LD-carboxypeptidase LdcB
MKMFYPIIIRIILVILVLGVGAGGFIGYQYYLLWQNELALKKDLLEHYRQAVDILKQELDRTKKERSRLELQLADEKYRVDKIAAEVQNLTGNVGTLVKLSKTDSKLLQKYSKIYFLNEHYVPSKLMPVDPQYVFDPQKEYLIHKDVWPFLQMLLDAASSSQMDLKVISAYRSFGTQSELKSSYKMIYGSGANQFSADQGYSEHQLGTTVDFTTSKLGANFTAFEKTPAYQWLTQNAYKYGFILSYPKDNVYYRFEPWHWRFVGRSLAEKLYKEKKYFYELEQREIDEYLISIFD